jgi:uncharacterized protein
MVVVFALMALLVGVVLGLLGGGGSILMVPLLVYVVGFSPAEAVPLSLLVVGVTSLVALVPHARQGRVHLAVGSTFGGAGMVGAFAGGRVSHLLPSALILAGFGALMLGTAASMLRRRKAAVVDKRRLRIGLVLAVGSSVGFVSGLLGAGGGFLIMPALVLFGGLSVRSAIGTSLFVIALQSLSGFLGHLSQPFPDLGMVAALCAATAAGSLLGAAFSAQIPQEKLRRAFAWLVLILGAFVLFAPVQSGVRAILRAEWPWWAVSVAGGALIGLAAALLWLLEGRIGIGRLACARTRQLRAAPFRHRLRPRWIGASCLVQQSSESAGAFRGTVRDPGSFLRRRVSLRGALFSLAMVLGFWVTRTIDGRFKRTALGASSSR